MSIFDLAFILAFLASVMLLCAAIVAFLGRRWRRGVKVLRAYGIGLAITWPSPPASHCWCRKRFWR